jgi:hypothetical protein
LADLSRFDDLLNRAKEKKKPKPDIKQVFKEFEAYRAQADAPVAEKSVGSEKPKKPKQPEKDFLV